MYVGGYFTQTADGTVTGLNSIAKYNMITGVWSALPHNGLDSSVRSIAFNGNNMYVGGVFTQTMDGTVTNLKMIAKFNTTTNTWSSLPRGGLSAWLSQSSEEGVVSRVKARARLAANHLRALAAL